MNGNWSEIVTYKQNQTEREFSYGLNVPSSHKMKTASSTKNEVLPSCIPEKQGKPQGIHAELFGIDLPYMYVYAISIQLYDFVILYLLAT